MHAVDTITLIGGLGVLLFSLRVLTGALRRSIGRRFRPILLRYLSRPAHGFAAGLVVTALMQASSITIVTTMGLVTTTLITLEQGIHVMLGATVGTTVKFWLMTGNLQYGRVLVGVASVLYLVVRHPLVRELLEVAIAVGFAFLGLEMMAQGVAPLAADPGFVALIRSMGGGTLGSQLMAVGTGFLLTTVMQSSSAMLFLSLGFASKGLVTLPAGVALVIGLNAGTTVTALIASAELDWRGRRLALAHVLVKVSGALVALLFFPTFVSLVELLSRGVGGASDVAIQLAMAHTVFNLLNAGVWAFGAGLLVRILRAATPSDPVSAIALAPVVRRMLASAPERALVEAERQMDRLRQLAKALVDDAMGLLTQAESGNSPLLSGRAFDEVREALQELLLQLGRSTLAAARGEQFARMLAEVDSCQALYEEGLGLMAHLQRGLPVEGPQVPLTLAPRIEALARAFDGRWIQVVFPGSMPDAAPPGPAGAHLTAAFFELVRVDPGARMELLTWLQETVARLSRIAERLDELLESGSAARGARPAGAANLASSPGA